MREKECPECRWVPVVDASGRSHLEMRWNPRNAAPAGGALRRAA